MQTDNGQIVLTLMNVRLSYFYGFRPMKGKNDEGKETENYCVHAIMAPDHPQLDQVRQAIRAVAAEAWPRNHADVLTQLAAQDRLCIHKGDVSKAGQEAYAGKFYISANSKVRPTIIETRNGANVPLVESDGRPYSGSWGNVMVAIYAQGADGKPGKWGKRVNAQFMGVQHTRHDERFGGGRVAKPDEFGLAPTDADAAAPEPTADANGLI
jgi:hypothetical protein